MCWIGYCCYVSQNVTVKNSSSTCNNSKTNMITHYQVCGVGLGSATMHIYNGRCWLCILRWSMYLYLPRDDSDWSDCAQTNFKSHSLIHLFPDNLGGDAHKPSPSCGGHQGSCGLCKEDTGRHHCRGGQHFHVSILPETTRLWLWYCLSFSHQIPQW